MLFRSRNSTTIGFNVNFDQESRFPSKACPTWFFAKILIRNFNLHLSFFFSPGKFLKGNIPLKETSPKFLRSITNHILAAKDSKSKSSHYNNDSRVKERKKERGKKKTYSALIHLIWSYYKPKKLPDSQFIIVCQFCSYTSQNFNSTDLLFVAIYVLI